MEMIQMFKCSICGSQYITEAEALACEAIPANKGFTGKVGDLVQLPAHIEAQMMPFGVQKYPGNMPNIPQGYLAINPMFAPPQRMVPVAGTRIYPGTSDQDLLGALLHVEMVVIRIGVNDFIEIPWYDLTTMFAISPEIRHILRKSGPQEVSRVPVNMFAPEVPPRVISGDDPSSMWGNDPLEKARKEFAEKTMQCVSRNPTLHKFPFPACEFCGARDTCKTAKMFFENQPSPDIDPNILILGLPFIECKDCSGRCGCATVRSYRNNGCQLHPGIKCMKNPGGITSPTSDDIPDGGPIPTKPKSRKPRRKD